MGFTHSFRHTLKPIGFTIFYFALISSLFVIGYIFVDYQGYVKEYRARQAQEIVTIHQKTEATLKQLGKMLSLIESRIYDSQGDMKRIQRVLTSIHQLQSVQNIPEIQKVSYYKLTTPQMVITRYGEVPLAAEKILMETDTLKERESTFHAEHKGLVGRMPVLGLEGTAEGILELQISFAEFWKFLGTYETVSFDENIRQNQEGGLFFHLQKNVPDSFLTYGLAHQSIYKGLACYLLFSLILLGVCLYSLNGYFQRSFGKKAEKLEEAFLDLQEIEKKLREELWFHKQDAQSHQTSCQLQRKL